jgi:hypothetical protein
MTDETKKQSKGIVGHAAGCQCGCGPKPQATLVEGEKVASEKLAREAVIRARNKRVREPSHVHGPNSAPAFTDHSGEL